MVERLKQTRDVSRVDAASSGIICVQSQPRTATPQNPRGSSTPRTQTQKKQLPPANLAYYRLYGFPLMLEDGVPFETMLRRICGRHQMLVHAAIGSLLSQIALEGFVEDGGQ